MTSSILLEVLPERLRSSIHDSKGLTCRQPFTVVCSLMGEEKIEKSRKRKLEDGKDDDNTLSKEARKARRAKRKELLERVPKTDENGISYTKQQLRRMAKRVARGLDPVETEKEKQERLKADAQLRREEEAELAGIVYRKENPAEDFDDDDDDDGDGDGEDSGNNGEIISNEDLHNQDVDESGAALSEEKQDKFDHFRAASSVVTPTKKKSRRNKPVPADYVCSACKKQSLHWIYDCPDKVTRRGTNQQATTAKGRRRAAAAAAATGDEVAGVHDPDARKVFVSGLPFSMKRGDLMKLMAPCGQIAKTKLLQFPDTGRCKGQAYVTFASKEGAKKALALSGSMIDNDTDSGEGQKTKSSSNRRKQLKLKVTKVLNRLVTQASSSSASSSPKAE